MAAGGGGRIRLEKREKLGGGGEKKGQLRECRRDMPGSMKREPSYPCQRGENGWETSKKRTMRMKGIYTSASHEKTTKRCIWPELLWKRGTPAQRGRENPRGRFLDALSWS